MSDTSLEQTESTPPAGGNATEPGGFGTVEVTDASPPAAPAPPADITPVPSAALRRSQRLATVEHLAARRSYPPLNADDPEVKQKLSALRTELTTLVTDFRWGEQSAQVTAERIIPLLDVGPLQQWIPVLIPTILEIDRAGNLVPVWLKILDQEDPHDLPADANPADTTTGRARRIAILMLGYYKTPELSELLGKLAADPHSSLYATQSLIKQGTTAAMQALASALKEARGWAKVDIMDAFATLNQARFYEIMLASGLDDAEGLESYLAVPLYRAVPLEQYLRGERTIAPRLTQQAASVLSQILQESMVTTSGGTAPIVFERDLPRLATALFEGVKSTSYWRSVIALHRLGLFLGRYWSEISRGMVQDPRILQQVYACLPLMPEVERWMNERGRAVLLDALAHEEEAFGPCLKVLTELREPRVTSVLLARLDSTTKIPDREQAIRVGQMCDTLVQLGDRRAIASLRELVRRTVNIDERAARPKRRVNLATGDEDITGSIVYAAAIRTSAQFGDRGAYDFVVRAAQDFDPYVRTQALEALKTIDPKGEESRSRWLVRECLNDPSDTVLRVACQLAAQYHDIEAIPLLQRLAETRPELAPAAQGALRQLG